MNTLVEEAAKETYQFLSENIKTVSKRDIEVEIQSLKLLAYNMGRMDQRNEDYDNRFRQTVDKGSDIRDLIEEDEQYFESFFGGNNDR